MVQDIRADLYWADKKLLEQGLALTSGSNLIPERDPEGEGFQQGLSLLEVHADPKNYDPLQVILFREPSGEYSAASYQDDFRESIEEEGSVDGLLAKVKENFEDRLNLEYARRSTQKGSVEGLYRRRPWKKEDADQLLAFAKRVISDGITNLELNDTRSFTAKADPTTTFNIEYYLAK